MALVAIGDDGPSSERPESPLHLGDDETAQDDATEIGGGRKRKGKSTRWNIPSSALSMLEQMFSKDKFPSVETRKKIATDLKVTPRQVQVWFQNKRQRSTKPPGRPTDTRSILNTSEDIQAALMNFGIGVTCGFGPNSVDPTLGQLEVFANERQESNSSQAAMLFGTGLNSGCGFSANGSDAGLHHQLEGGAFAREEGGSRNPRLPAGRANTQLSTTEAWMAAAAAQMASLAAANSIANAAAEGKLADSPAKRAAASMQGHSQAAGAGGVNWWCPGGSGQPSSSQSVGGMPWGMLPPNFGGTPSSSLLSALPPAAISQMLSGGAAMQGGMSRSMSSESLQRSLSTDYLPGCAAGIGDGTSVTSALTDPGSAPTSVEVKHELVEASASSALALREANFAPADESTEATDAPLFLQLTQQGDASGIDVAALGGEGEPSPAPLTDDAEVKAATLDEAALAALLASKGVSGTSAATAAALAASNPAAALSALAAGDASGQMSESARLLLIKHWQQMMMMQHNEQRQLAQHQQASQQASQNAQHQLSQLAQAGLPAQDNAQEESAPTPTVAPPVEPVKEEEEEVAATPLAEPTSQESPTPNAAGEAEAEAATDEDPSTLSLQQAQQLQQQQQLRIQRQQLQRQQMQQQQQLQHQQLIQRQQQAQQHSQLVAAQQMLQQQQQQQQQQQVRAQAARQHLQQQAAQHLQQARAQAQAQALSQALTQAQSQAMAQSMYEQHGSFGHANAQVAQAQAMHEAKRRGGLQGGLAACGGGPSQETTEDTLHAEGQGKQKRGRRRSKSELSDDDAAGAGAAAAGLNGERPASSGQPGEGDDLMDELIESLFTEELGTIRYQQQATIGQPLPETPSAPEAASPPPEIPSSLSPSAGGNSRKRSSPSSDDNLCGNDILQFEVDDALLLDV